MRSLATAATLLALVCCGLVVTTPSRRELQRAAAPERLPPALGAPVGEPSAWIFVRTGCPRCASHLRALVRSAARLAPGPRARALRRVHLVGSVPELPAEFATRPDSLRGALGVRMTPTTWLADADGRVRECWWGARDERSWDRALGILANPEARP